YSQNSKAYIVLNKHTKKVKESLNVTFDETPLPSKTLPLVDDDLDEEEAIKVIEKKNLKNDIVDETLEIDEIVNIKESRNHPLENVIENLKQRTLRSQSQNKRTKWVFRNKLDENGIVSRNKARLVAQGGIDYDETYAPVARLESIRILLYYACALDFKLFQMDVKSAFLNGFINKEEAPKTSHLEAGNIQSNNSNPTQLDDNLDDGQTPGLRRSTRQSKPPVKLKDYVLSSNIKYGIEKYVNYSKLKGGNLLGVCGYRKLSIKPLVRLKDTKLGLVSKGFGQREGFDYDETFNHVIKMVTVRCLISIDVSNSWPFYQLDVNNAFLCGDLKEDVYMYLPEGCESNNKHKVCKLNKSLYGLKQAPRQWNAKLTIALIKHGFEQSKFDYSLYVKKKGSMFVALLVYVDDIVITGNDEVEVKSFKSFLSSKFLINDLGEGVVNDKLRKGQGKQLVGTSA
nr:ribonuclease H-like domain-containing protein [Tanacetum cinerariifolium]